ncbi:ribonuclease P protein component 3 [Methanolobus bombayensis]|uniref:ribonuclease P protein component 3 n=1 Tax=Methanolobus bombayensis TaxID=38023 RepID=UPI001AE4E8CC|nr:ribonuclease P protein component 3 [Methanolobus bombayensis]MBP1908791.1 ribonuclease P/MRP protein subunit RPP1 [Methanolobus bombayensis]
MVNPSFYDLHVYSVPEGKNTIEEMASFSLRLGISGIAITNPSQSCQPERAQVFDDFEVFSGVEIRVDNPSRLHGMVGKYRKKTDVIVIRGGTENINRAAVENSNVDILSGFGSMKDNGLNHILARSASDNDVAIAFDLGEVVSQRGGRRVRTLSNFRKDLALVRKYDVPFILTSNAGSCYDLRAPRELIALAGLFGMTKEEAISGLSSTPECIISRNRPSKSYVFEGVEIVDSTDVFSDKGDEK